MKWFVGYIIFKRVRGRLFVSSIANTNNFN